MSIPRRAKLYELTSAELALCLVIRKVEQLGASPELTDVVIKIGEAFNLLADIMDPMILNNTLPKEALMKDGAQLIADERARQILMGYTLERDKKVHTLGNMAQAGVCYALADLTRIQLGESTIPPLWPWASEMYKPSKLDRVKELTKSGGLIAAEIDLYISNTLDEINNLNVVK